MELAGAVVIVTGAASGIGRALARRAVAEGARGVVACDLDGDGARAIAEQLDGERKGVAAAAPGDASRPADVAAAIALARERFGEVDLYCANAGVADGRDEQAPDELWRRAFAVNVDAHVVAARLLVPGWLERGRGYFLATASAAGLLTQIGSAPYAVTKHAAVGFAEWLSVTYGDRGIGVSCLCPMGVATGMLRADVPPDDDELAGHVVKAAGRVLEPEDVAATVVEGLRDERFLILPHPEVLDYYRHKGADYERWLAGMRRLQAGLQAQRGEG